MTEERFLELLNLYLDQEISPDDLSDLMAETRLDTERQKVFLDYCRIHKACSQLGRLGSGSDRRSFKQTIYALGGLAAAFALLGLAGRNLMPYMDGENTEVTIARQSEAQPVAVFFPEVANTEVLSNRIFQSDSEPRIEYAGLTNLNFSGEAEGATWRDGIRLAGGENTLNFMRESLFSNDLLDAGPLNLQDPFNAFNDFSDAASIEFSRASFAPASGFGSAVSRDSRSNLK